MRPYFLALGFFSMDSWAFSMQSIFTCLVCAFSCPFSASNRFLAGQPYLQEREILSAERCMWKNHRQFTCCTCSLPAKTGKFSCSYAASISSGVHAIAHYEASKSQALKPAGCRLSCLQFAADFLWGVIADCLQLQVYWYNCGHVRQLICGFFLHVFAVIF